MKIFRKELWQQRMGIYFPNSVWVDECNGKEVIDGFITLDNGDFYMIADEWCEEVE